MSLFEDLSQSASLCGGTGRKSLILKRRDVRVVEGARLASEAGQQQEAISTRINTHAISALTFQSDHSVCARKPRCSLRF